MIPGGAKGIEIGLRLHLAQFQAGLAAAGGQVRAFGATVSKDLEKPKQNLGMLGTAGVVAGAAVAAGMGVAVARTMAFDKQLSQLRAVSGATADDMEAIREKALQLGADTSFNANEAAMAMTELAKAGVSVEAMMGGAADATVALAEAGGVDLARAAEIAAAAMFQFGLEARDVGKIADLLAGAANATLAEVEGLGTALAYVGPIAHAAGLSIEDTTVAIGLLAQGGLDASTAGTSLRAILAALQPTTDRARKAMQDLGLITEDGANQFFDAQGNIKSFSEIAALLRGTLGGLTKQQQIYFTDLLFGQRSLSAVSIIAGTTEEQFAALNDEILNTSAADVAADRMDNLAGDLEELSGAIETALIEGGSKATGALRGMAQAASTVVDGFSAMPGPLQNTALGLVGVIGAGAGLAGLGIKVAETQKKLMSMGTIAQAVGRNMGALTLASAGVGVALVGLAYIWGDIQRRQAEAKQIVDTYTEAIRRQTGAIEDNIDAATRQQLASSGLGALLVDTSADVDLLAEAVRDGRAELEGLAVQSGLEYGAGLIPFLREARDGGSELAAELLGLQESGELSHGELRRLVSGLSEYSLRLAESREEVRIYNAVAGETGDAAAGAALGVDGLASAVDGLGNDAAGATDELLKLVDAAQSVFDADMALASASRSVQDAQQSVADGGRELNRLAKERADAQRGVVEAQRGVERVLRDIDGAARDAEKAQLDLVDAQAGVARIEREMAGAARENRVAQLDLADARRAVEDVQRKIVGLVREEHIAKLDVIDAEKALRKLQEDRKAAPRDLRSAELDLEEAELAVLEAQKRRYEGGTHLERKKSGIDLERAQMRLVEAEERLKRLRRDQKEESTELARAEYRLEDARKAVNGAGDRAIELAVEHERAQMRVTDAEAALSDQQRIGEERARALQRAQMAVADATDRVAAVDQAAADRAWELQRAQDAVRDASDRVNQVNRRGADLARDRARASEDLQQAMVDEALAAVELAIKQREANGETVTGAEKARLMMDAIDNLIPRIGTDSPMGRRLMEWRDQLASHVTPAMQAAVWAVDDMVAAMGRLAATDMGAAVSIAGEQYYAYGPGYGRPGRPTGMAAGGVTRPRSVYRVHDTTEPEIYQQSDGTSLLLTGAAAGHITPASQMMTAQQADVMSRRHGGGGGLDVDRLGIVIGEQVAQQMAIAAPAGHKGDLTAIVQLDRREIARAVFQDTRERGG